MMPNKTRWPAARLPRSRNTYLVRPLADSSPNCPRMAKRMALAAASWGMSATSTARLGSSSHRRLARLSPAARRPGPTRTAKAPKCNAPTSTSVCCCLAKITLRVSTPNVRVRTARSIMEHKYAPANQVSSAPRATANWTLAAARRAKTAELAASMATATHAPAPGASKVTTVRRR